jgi:hypothetical protein
VHLSQFPLLQWFRWTPHTLRYASVQHSEAVCCQPNRTCHDCWPVALCSTYAALEEEGHESSAEDGQGSKYRMYSRAAGCHAANDEVGAHDHDAKKCELQADDVHMLHGTVPIDHAQQGGQKDDCKPEAGGERVVHGK